MIKISAPVKTIQAPSFLIQENPQPLPAARVWSRQHDERLRFFPIAGFSRIFPLASRIELDRFSSRWSAVPSSRRCSHFAQRGDGAGRRRMPALRLVVSYASRSAVNCRCFSMRIVQNAIRDQHAAPEGGDYGCRSALVFTRDDDELSGPASTHCCRRRVQRGPGAFTAKPSRTRCWRSSSGRSPGCRRNNGRLSDALLEESEVAETAAVERVSEGASRSYFARATHRLLPPSGREE